jgi:hypothetical protein
MSCRTSSKGDSPYEAYIEVPGQVLYSAPVIYNREARKTIRSYEKAVAVKALANTTRAYAVLSLPATDR